MCGCFILLLGSVAPRLALFLMAIFNWSAITKPFNGEWIWPVLGFFLIPFTTLVYVLIYNWQGSVHGFSWFFVILAFFFDLGSYFGGYNRRGDFNRGAPAPTY
jgi:hypothetical protein